MSVSVQQAFGQQPGLSVSSERAGQLDQIIFEGPFQQSCFVLPERSHKSTVMSSIRNTHRPENAFSFFSPPPTSEPWHRLPREVRKESPFLELSKPSGTHSWATAAGNCCGERDWQSPRGRFWPLWFCDSAILSLQSNKRYSLYLQTIMTTSVYKEIRLDVLKVLTQH